MNSILTGFGFGVGFLLSLILISFIIYLIYRWSQKQETFTVELFELYKDELIREERFEEIPEVNQIIEQLSTGKTPKGLKKHFTIEIDTDVIIKSKGEDSIISFQERKKIVRKI